MHAAFPPLNTPLPPHTQLFHPVLLVFALILLVSSYKMATAGGGDDDDEDMGENQIVLLCRCVCA